MKKLFLLSFAVVLLSFYVGCEEDNDDTQNYDPETLAMMSSGGIEDASEHITDALSYVDGFSPEVPALYRGMEAMLDPQYNESSGWWFYDTTFSYIYGDFSQQFTVAESLMYKNSSGSFIQYPTPGIVNSLQFIEHYQLVQSGLTWDYYFNLTVDGVDIDESGVDHTTVNGQGSWRYDFSEEVFLMNIRYNNLVYVWNYGILQDYPMSGSFEIDYGSFASWIVTFDGDETAELTIYDYEGTEFIFVINLDTGAVVGPA